MFEVDRIAPDQAEVAVDVARADAKQPARELVIQPPDRDAMPGIVTLGFVAVDQPDLRRSLAQQQFDLARIVLAVAVGIENVILGCGHEAAAQRGSVASVDRMCDYAKAGSVNLLEASEHLAGIVHAAVVDDDNLEVFHKIRKDFERSRQQAGERLRVIVGREKYGQASALKGTGRPEPLPPLPANRAVKHRRLPPVSLYDR